MTSHSAVGPRLITSFYDRVARFALVWVLALALLLALTYIWLQPPTLHSGETAHTWPIVSNLVHGRGYAACFSEYFPFCNAENQTTAQREPLPVLIFAGVAWLSNDSLLIAACVNVLVYLATLCGIFWLAQLLAGHRAAILAALFWALYLPAIKLITSLSGDLMAAMWAVFAGVCIIRARQHGRWYDWVSAGICVGCAALSRSALLAFAPAIVGGTLLWMLGKRQRIARTYQRTIYGLALFGVAVSVVIAPWIVRNERVFGRAIVGSTLVGYNLYRENYQLGSADILRYIDGPEARVAVQQLFAHYPTLRGTENEAQIDSLYTHAAFAVIRAHPRSYLLLTAYRGLMLWFDIGVASSDQTGTGEVARFVRIEQGVLLLTAAFGVLAYWRRVWPLALGIAAVSLLYMLVNSMLRYSVPLMPLVIALSALAITTIPHAWQREAP